MIAVAYVASRSPVTVAGTAPDWRFPAHRTSLLLPARTGTRNKDRRMDLEFDGQARALHYTYHLYAFFLCPSRSSERN